MHKQMRRGKGRHGGERKVDEEVEEEGEVRVGGDKDREVMTEEQEEVVEDGRGGK